MINSASSEPCSTSGGTSPRAIMAASRSRLDCRLQQRQEPECSN
jgi:hypothetical protein